MIFLTFFTNLVLMACFLGMSVGCLASSRERDLINTVVPLTVWTVLLSCGVLVFFFSFGRVVVEVGGQGSPQQVYFGTEYRPKDPSYFVLPIELIAGLFFILIALIFVGLGQVMGRSFNQISNRVLAYTINIAGSLAGIVAFGIASYFRTSPLVWFGISIGLGLYFTKGPRKHQVAKFIALLLLVSFFSGYGPDIAERIFLVAVLQGRLRSRAEVDRDQQHLTPSHAPHFRYFARLQLTALAPPRCRRGAVQRCAHHRRGIRNDVQAALAHGARHVDAVEIDPVINEIGVRDHPDHPYSDSRVSVHIDDGRSSCAGGQVPTIS